MYEKIDSSLDFTGREEQILRFWKENHIFEKQRELRRESPVFTFYDGPPTANGKPHIGHVLTRAIKDLIPRYQSMKGHNVLRIAGWDTHGLPVELEVEKQLGINGKGEIESYGIEPFIRKCKESVWKYKHEWEEMSDRVGYWADMEHPYVTYENSYIESEWWALKKIADQGLLYEGHKIVPYCPRCGTALASHEVAQGYHDVKEMSVYVRFRVKGQEKTWFAAWTTTPWTLPSNVALCVNPSIDYVLVEREEADGINRYYVADALKESVFPDCELKIVETIKGAALENMDYEPIFPYGLKAVEKSHKRAYFVTLGDHVTTTDGTGIVHTAPAFGEDDARVGHAYDLPFVQLLKADGTLPEDVTDFSGQFCKEADPRIIEKLAQDGSLIRKMMYEHNYPFCWRCDTPLVYYARNGWFIRMTELREQLMANNSEINWIPASIGEGRFGNFLENVNDWAISRERYWGMPLPIWRCPDCGETKVVGSFQELKETACDCPEELELHRPYVDQVHIPCPHCGGTMHRVPEVIDCWFDSGAMPFAQWHYPFENKEAFEAHFPADFISEAVDQTRGWFYSLTAEAALLFGKKAFNNCVVLGLVQDKNGQKMSKHKGNVVAPEAILSSEGADATRWYFYSASQPWLPSRFSPEAVNEGKRRFMGTLWNTASFFVLYANIDQFEPEEHPLRYETLGVMDRWILSRLNTLIDRVDHSLGAYDITAAARSLEEFVDELSNWYVRRGRERYWQPGMEKDKADAYATLYEVLKTLAQLSAPFTPFMAESLYQSLCVGHLKGAPESVHLTDFPAVRREWIDAELEKEMALVLKIVALGRTARAESSIKTRQPLAKIWVVSQEHLNAEHEALVTDELNVKSLEWCTDATTLQNYHFKPQLKVLGKRFGKQLGLVKEALEALDGQKAYQSLERDGKLTLLIEGKEEVFTQEDLIIETGQADGLASASESGLTVALETRLTPELIEEGLVREIISKVQTMRKEAGFEVVDRIVLTLSGDPELLSVAKNRREELSKAVLATAIDCLEDGVNETGKQGYGKDWSVNGKQLYISVRKAGNE